MRIRQLLPILVPACIALALLAGCGGDSPTNPNQPTPPVPAGANVVVQWNKALVQAIKEVKHGPPQTAREIAIVHTCMYDAWAPYDPVAVGTRYGNEMRRPESERNDGFKSKAMSYAAYRALVDLFPGDTQKAAFLKVMTDMGYDPNDTAFDHTTPAGIGNACAAAVLAMRHVDGSNQLGNLGPSTAPYSDYTGYVPLNPAIDMEVPTLLGSIPAPDHWQPLTYPAFAGATPGTPPFAGPHWGNVIPFAMTTPAQFRPVPPAALGTEAFRVQAQELIELSAQLNDDWKCTVEYWADPPGTAQPPGHWIEYAEFISARDQNTLDEDAKMFFAVSNALLDAGIAVWDAKRYYDYVRPVTAVRYLFQGQTIHAWGGPGQGSKDIDAATWHTYQTPFFPTPPFAEYPSGHSGFSAAGAEIFKRFTGSDNFGFTFTTLRGALAVEPGVAPSRDIHITYDTFSAAADAAGWSRRYGGIHFKDGDVASRRIGRQVGSVVWERAQSFWNGTATPFRVAGEVLP